MRHFTYTMMSLSMLTLAGCGTNFNFKGSSSSNASSMDTTASTGNGTSSTGSSSTGNPIGTCSPQAAQDLKIMVVWDASGSTQSDDAKAEVRTQTMVNFLNANASQTNILYSFSYFASNVASYDFSNASWPSNSQSTYALPKQTFGTNAQALTAVSSFQTLFEKNQISNSGTSYTDAFAALQATIAADMAQDPKASYAVVFMSDGQPNRGATTVSTITPLVNALYTVTGAGRLSVSTVYFWTGSQSTGEAQIMQSIASTGFGQYVSAETGSAGNLNLQTMIQSLLNVPSVACTAH